jgi:hypothetical protein
MPQQTLRFAIVAGLRPVQPRNDVERFAGLKPGSYKSFREENSI